MDWNALFVPEVSPLEVVIRGTVMYFFIYLLLRFLSERGSGAMGITEYWSITDKIILVAVIMFRATALNAMAWRLPSVRTVVKPQPLALAEVVPDGKLSVTRSYDRLKSQRASRDRIA